VKESFYFGTQPLKESPRRSHFTDAIEMIGGADRLLYDSDYPSPIDYDIPTAINELPGLSDGDE
jgi:hypothetical protein